MSEPMEWGAIGQALVPQISGEAARMIFVKAIRKLRMKYPTYLCFLLEEMEDWRASQPWNPGADFYDADSSEDETETAEEPKAA